MNEDCLHMAHLRDSAKYIKCHSETNLISYKKLRNDAKQRFRFAKRDFFINGSRIGTKSFWKNIKNCTGLGCLKFLIHPWPHATSDQAKVSANKLNQYFIKSVANITSQFQVTSLSSSSLPPKSDGAEFSFAHITKFDMLAAIKTPSSTSSASFDEITCKIAKMFRFYYCYPTSEYFQQVTRYGDFSGLLKIGYHYSCS